MSDQQPQQAPEPRPDPVAVGSAGLHAAVSLFTWFPVPPVTLDRETARRAMAALPWVGLLIGLAAGAIAAVVGLFGGGGLLAAVAGLGVVALASGAMHLDGLADTADGLGSRKPAADALAVMKASDIGPMGVTALVLVLGLDAAALASPHLAGAALPAALLIMPVVGRLGALIGTGRWWPAARPDGLGALVAGVTSDLVLLVSGLAVLVVAALAGGLAQGARGVAVFMLGALLAAGAAVAWQRHLHRRLGGVTGDTLGSLVEVAQAAFVLVVALAL
jgi:adenosylcobinamide-GDP ribazoletransferase